MDFSYILLTLGSKCEKAKDYSIDCYVAKALPVKYQITAHRHVAKTRFVAKTKFVTLLSTKVLNSLEIVVIAEKSFSWGSTICPTSTQLFQHA